MHRVLIVGGSLFADTLAQMLSGSVQVEVLEVIGSLEHLASSIERRRPDAIIVADTHDQYLCTNVCLRVRCDIPIIYTTLSDEYLTIFTSQRVKAAQTQLLAAIAALPVQSAQEQVFVRDMNIA